MQYQIQTDHGQVVLDGIDQLTFCAGDPATAYQRVQAQVSTDDDLQSAVLIALSKEIEEISFEDVLELQTLLDIEETDAVVARIFAEVVSTVTRWNRGEQTPNPNHRRQRGQSALADERDVVTEYMIDQQEGR